MNCCEKASTAQVFNIGCMEAGNALSHQSTNLAAVALLAVCTVAMLPVRSRNARLSIDAGTVPSLAGGSDPGP